MQKYQNVPCCSIRTFVHLVGAPGSSIYHLALMLADDVQRFITAAAINNNDLKVNVLRIRQRAFNYICLVQYGDDNGYLWTVRYHQQP